MCSILRWADCSQKCKVARLFYLPTTHWGCFTPVFHHVWLTSATGKWQKPCSGAKEAIVENSSCTTLSTIKAFSTSNQWMNLSKRSSAIFFRMWLNVCMFDQRSYHFSHICHSDINRWFLFVSMTTHICSADVSLSNTHRDWHRCASALWSILYTANAHYYSGKFVNTQAAAVASAMSLCHDRKWTKISTEHQRCMKCSCSLLQWDFM